MRGRTRSPCACDEPLSLAAAADLGASRVWLSPELTLGQIADLAEDAPVELGLTIIGSQELMVTEHCLLMSQGPCDEECDACPRRKSPHFLRDRKEYEFPVVTDALGRSHLYNGVQLDVAHALPDLVHAGVSVLMVDATLMNVEETTRPSPAPCAPAASPMPAATPSARCPAPRAAISTGVSRSFVVP